MTLTESQRKALRKYDAKTYKSIACKCKITDYKNFKNMQMVKALQV